MIGDFDAVPARGVESKENLGRRIIVADDDKENRELFVQLLKEGGYIVQSVEDGQQLLDLFEKKGVDYDAIVTDNNMPKVDGLEAVAQIREKEGFENLPVILMSGLDVSIEDRAKIKGPEIVFLQKPIHITSLLREVKRGIEDRALAVVDMLIGRLEGVYSITNTTILLEVNRIRDGIRDEVNADRERIKNDIKEIALIIKNSGIETPESRADIAFLRKFFRIKTTKQIENFKRVPVSYFSPSRGPHGISASYSSVLANLGDGNVLQYIQEGRDDEVRKITGFSISELQEQREHMARIYRRDGETLV